MKNWLQKNLVICGLEDSARDYLQARAFEDSLIASLGIITWTLPQEPCTDNLFVNQFGEYGEELQDKLITPLRSPRGSLIGIEARSYIGKKTISRFLLPAAEWNPIWIGSDISFNAIYNGSPVWVVEGLFDLAAIRRVLPKNSPVLASLRAKLTDKHLLFLKRFASYVNMVYDRDETGRNGTKRALYDLKNLGIPCRDVPYRGGKDPGDIWDKTGDYGLDQAFSYVR
jgi:DNA primase